MLDRMSSKELSAWIAYEQANGLVDNTYTNDMLAQVVYHLQRVFGAVAAQAGVKGDQIPEPEMPLRPGDLMKKARALWEAKQDGVGPEFLS